MPGHPALAEKHGVIGREVLGKECAVRVPPQDLTQGSLLPAGALHQLACKSTALPLADLEDVYRGVRWIQRLVDPFAEGEIG